MSGESAFKFQVTGLVQGVGFRAFVQVLGTQLGLTGWVKNQSDGSVAGHVEGDRGLVLEFLRQLRIGNRWSSVEAVHHIPVEASGEWPRFEIRY